jgi:KUP system potassium uptake protein
MSKQDVSVQEPQRARSEREGVAAGQHSHPHGTGTGGRYLAALALGALGVVYGDIGTSPLYALREVFHGPYGITPNADNVYGVLSLVFWSLIIVISLKYINLILRADNRGEGGILALTALATPIRPLLPSRRRWLVLLGVFGASLLYGDGVITPAISVLSAVEGLKVATPLFEPYVLPITIAIIVGLFLIQSRGTGRIGRLFGPIMLLWFSVLGLLGVIHIFDNPSIFLSLNPIYGFNFFLDNGVRGFLVLGTVFLVVTGGEALYADMGHFGRKPITIAWFALVLPALLLNYFGQGAMLLNEPERAENLFYMMAPEWATLPLVALSTMATIIASQALISGAFSITMQAQNLGFLPRLRVVHTSPTEFGQIYIPSVNWLLMVACIAVVLGFRTSSNLAAAYGIAVTADMVITTTIFAIVARERWKWSLARVIGLISFFLVIDLAFFGANVVKIPQGGWFSLTAAVVVFAVMTTWKRGSRIIFTYEQHLEQSLDRQQEAGQQPDARPAPAPVVARHYREHRRRDRHGERHRYAVGRREVARGAEADHDQNAADHQRPVDRRDVDLAELGRRGVDDRHARQEAQVLRLHGDREDARDQRLRGDDRGGRGHDD